MTENHDGRRVRMTKRLMKDALLELLEQKELVSISVTSICEAADVHRSSFYKYYTNPADLLQEIERDILERIPVPPESLDQQSEKSFLAVMTAFFDFVRQNEKAFCVLLGGTTGDCFASRLVEYLCRGFISVDGEPDESSERFIRLYIANGTVGMLREWVSTGFPISSERIAGMMYSLSKKVVS